MFEHFSLAGRFVGRQGPFSVPGSIDGTAKGTTVAVTMKLKRNLDGTMSAEVPSCKAVMRSTDFKVKPEGPLAPFVAPYRV